MPLLLLIYIFFSCDRIELCACIYSFIQNVLHTRIKCFNLPNYFPSGYVYQRPPLTPPPPIVVCFLFLYATFPRVIDSEADAKVFDHAHESPDQDVTKDPFVQIPAPVIETLFTDSFRGGNGTQVRFGALNPWHGNSKFICLCRTQTMVVSMHFASREVLCAQAPVIRQAHDRVPWVG